MEELATNPFVRKIEQIIEKKINHDVRYGLFSSAEKWTWLYDEELLTEEDKASPSGFLLGHIYTSAWIIRKNNSNRGFITVLQAHQRQPHADNFYYNLFCQQKDWDIAYDRFYVPISEEAALYPAQSALQSSKKLFRDLNIYWRGFLNNSAGFRLPGDATELLLEDLKIEAQDQASLAWMSARFLDSSVEIL